MLGGRPIWKVVGGGSKGGIVVRTGQDVSSEEAPVRLSTGATIEEIQLEGERLKFNILTGNGPNAGWVSQKFKGQDLVVKTDELAPFKVWQVVGGKKDGGIKVRAGKEKDSQEEPERLSCDAFVKQLELDGERLFYERLSGEGPYYGWVSLKFKDKDLLVKVEQPTGDAAPQPEATPQPEPVAWPIYGDPLEIKLSNPEKDFSYEGYQSWVPHAAAVASLWREKKPFLPLRVEPLPGSSLKPMAPFKRFTSKSLKEATKQTLPGCMSGLLIPKSVTEMVSDRYGHEWLTQAFHAAGTLPKDNKVVKITECKELPLSGFDAAGGAAMKMFITVEYLKPDPELHTELFAKYPYPFETHPGPRTECSAFNDIDGGEIRANHDLARHFPFRTAKFYFGDICRETSDWILITERIPFGKRGTFEMGKCLEDNNKPYELYPVCGKYQDWLLPNPAEFYCCIFRTIGRMGAWDKLGAYDFFFGPSATYDEGAYLMMSQRKPMPKTMPAKIKETVEKMFDQGIDFIMNTIPTIASKEILDKAKLTKVKEEVLEVAPYFSDLTNFYQVNNSNYMAAVHVNLQPDNAFFWRDEYGDLACGVIDFGGFSRMPIIPSFMGVLVGAEADLMLAHEEGIIRSFVDEYQRCGGPALDFEEVQLRYHLMYISVVYDCLQWIERDILKMTTKEALRKMSGALDPDFQGLFRVRCRTLTISSGWEYYIKRGSFKKTFDKWANGAGKPYMTQYTV